MIMEHFEQTKNQAFPVRHAFGLLLLFGLLVRVLFLTCPGTEDMDSFRMWAAQACRHGLLQMYRESDTDILTSAYLIRQHIYLHRRFYDDTDLGPLTASPDHPPGMMVMLDASARLFKMINGGPLRLGKLLNACVNLPPVLFSLGITLLVWWFAGSEKLPQSLFAVTAFWLNPALILASPLLGYQDSMFAFFGLLSLVLFYRRRYSWSALAFAASCISKPEGMLLIPVLAAAAWADGGFRGVLRYSFRVGLFASAMLLPYALTHHLLAVFAHVFTLITDPALSGQELNVWWLVGPLISWVSGNPVVDASGMVRMYPRSVFMHWAGFGPAWIADGAVGIFIVLAMKMFLKQMKLGNRLALFWAGGVVVYGYTMLSLFVHENHLTAFFVYVAPMLALQVKNIKRLYLALSVVFGLNLYLFEGFGQNVKAGVQWLRVLPGFDVTILIALINIGLFLILFRARHWWFNLTAKDSYQP